MKSFKLFAIILPIILLTSCFGKTDEEQKLNDATQNQNTTQDQGVVTPEEQIRASLEHKRVQALDKLTSENLGTMLRKTDGRVELYDRRLFINYLKTKDINSTEKLGVAFKEIEEFAKKEGVTLTSADILVTLIGFDQENVSFDMCGDFNANKSKLMQDSLVLKELTPFCGKESNTSTESKKK